MTEVCLYLLAAPELEEKLLDQLLMHPQLPHFVSQPAASHGGHLNDLNQGEQVLGRGDAVLIQAQLTLKDANDLITTLRVDFAQSSVLFWIVPVLTKGML